MSENVTKWLIALILALIAGPMVSFLFGIYMPALIEDYHMSATDYSTLALGLKFFAMIPSAVVCPLWIRSVCIREKIKMRWWCLFGVFFQVMAIAVFFSYLAFHRLKNIEARLRLEDTGRENSKQSNRVPETD